MSKITILFAVTFTISSCTSAIRKPAADADASTPQEQKIKDMADQIKTAPNVPPIDTFQDLDMKFTFDQTWRIVTLGADKPSYSSGTYPDLTSDFKQFFLPLKHAAHRALTDPTEVSNADFRHILHPNGICLRGTWKMDNYGGTPYTGYFRPGTAAPLIVRASTHGYNVMVNTQHYNSFGFVGRIFQNDGPDKADFITQTDLGGVAAKSFFQSDAMNAPPVSPFHRKQHPLDVEVTKFLTTGAVFSSEDSNNSNRQVYTIAELGKGDEPTHAPPFMKFALSKTNIPAPNGPMDFRSEILANLPFTVEVDVSDDPGENSRLFGRKLAPNSPAWRRIGEVTFDAGTVSHACDFRLNIRHSPWRNDLNTPGTEKKKLGGH